MEVTAFMWALSLLVGGMVVFWALRRRYAGATPPVSEIAAGVQEALAIAHSLVAAAEQMSETGQISRDERFAYVFSQLRELFPGLSQDTLVAAIEGAVWLVTKLPASQDNGRPESEGEG